MSELLPCVRQCELVAEHFWIAAGHFWSVMESFGFAAEHFEFAAGHLGLWIGASCGNRSDCVRRGMANIRSLAPLRGTTFRPHFGRVSAAGSFACASTRSIFERAPPLAKAPGATRPPPRGGVVLIWLRPSQAPRRRLHGPHRVLVRVRLAPVAVRVEAFGLGVGRGDASCAGAPRHLRPQRRADVPQVYPLRPWQK